MKARKRGQLGYGAGVCVVDAADLPPSADELTARLLNLFRSPGYQPPRVPKVGLQLLELTRSPDANARKIIRVLEQDPMLAARVLQVAQSVTYAAKVPVSSLQHAVMRLGFDVVTDIVLEATMHMRIFRAPGYDEPMAALQKHSSATAHICRLVCRHADVADDYAFLCGLLHDIGIVAGLIAFSSQKKPPKLSKIRLALGEAHERAGKLLARLWDLPSDVGMVLEHHHYFRVDGETHRVAAVVTLADWLATELGAGSGWPSDTRQAMAAAGALGLSKTTQREIGKEAALIVTRVMS